MEVMWIEKVVLPSSLLTVSVGVFVVPVKPPTVNDFRNVQCNARLLDIAIKWGRERQRDGSKKNMRNNLCEKISFWHSIAEGINISVHIKTPTIFFFIFFIQQQASMMGFFPLTYALSHNAHVFQNIVNGKSGRWQAGSSVADHTAA